MNDKDKILELRSTMSKQQDLIDELESNQEVLDSENSELKAKIAEQAVHIKELTNCLNDRKTLCRQAFDANDAQAENIKQQAAQIEQLKAHNEMLIQAGCDGYLQGWRDAEDAKDRGMVYYDISGQNKSKEYANQIRQQASKCDT